MLDRLVAAAALSFAAATCAWVGLVLGMFLNQYVSWQTPAVVFAILFVVTFAYDWYTERHRDR